MGALKRLVHRLSGLPPPAETKPEDPVTRGYREAIEKNAKSSDKIMRANIALTDMLEAINRRGPPQKH